MDTLKDKQTTSYDYLSRYAGVNNYYDMLEDRNVGGICSNLKKDTAYIAHKITQEDSLDSLALKYYNNPTYWWVIAYFNDIQDPFIDLKNYTIIKIPTINSIEFGNER